MTVKILHLFERPEFVPHVARWIYEEFWVGKERYSAADLAALLSEATSETQIPLSLVALVDEQPVGTINLIANDDENRPQLFPWLAALVVIPGYRRQGIGSQLVRELLQCANRLKIKSLYLGTDNPRFYSRLGATTHERVNDEFQIMKLGVGA